MTSFQLFIRRLRRWPIACAAALLTVIAPTNGRENNAAQIEVLDAPTNQTQDAASQLLKQSASFIGEEEPTFFNEPVEDTRNEVAPVEQKSHDDQVRFLGIAKAAGDESPAVALFRINGDFHTFIEGEQRQGIRLNSIDPKLRTVNIELEGRTLQIHLLSQPIVNEAVSSPSPARRRPDRSTNASRSTTDPLMPTIDSPSMADLPDVQLPPLPQEVTNDIDRLPDLPDIPDLPLDLESDFDLDL